LYELKDHLISCYDFGYVGNNLKSIGDEQIETAKRNLNGFINFVKNKTKNK